MMTSTPANTECPHLPYACKQSRDRIREHYVAMVLGTDMKQHFNNCLIFSTKVSEAKGLARAESEAGDEQRSNTGADDTEPGSTAFPSSTELLGSNHVSGSSAVGCSSVPRLKRLGELATSLTRPPPPLPVHRSCATNSSEVPGGDVSASPRRSLQLQRGARPKSDMSHERYRASMLAGSSQLRPTPVAAAAAMDHHSNSSLKGLRLSGGHEKPMAPPSPAVRVDGGAASNSSRQPPTSPADPTLHSVTRAGTSMHSAGGPPQQAADPFLASAIAHLTTDDADRLLVWKVRHDEHVVKAFMCGKCGQ